MEAAARPELGQPRGSAVPGRARRPPGSDAGLYDRRFADLRADAGPYGGRAVRNTVPRDRAVLIYCYIGVDVPGGRGRHGAVVCRPAGLPTATDDPEFWLIAIFAVIVDAWPFSSPVRARASTVYSSIAFTFALLLGWGLAVTVIVQALAVVVSSIRLHHAWWRALFNMSQYALSFAAAALVLNVAGVARLSEDAPHGRPGLVAVMAIFGSAHRLVRGERPCS